MVPPSVKSSDAIRDAALASFDGDDALLSWFWDAYTAVPAPLRDSQGNVAQTLQQRQQQANVKAQAQS